MNGMGLVARHEYRNQVGQRSFLLSTLAVPLMLAIFILMGILAGGGFEKNDLGYVDPAGLMDAVDVSAMEMSTGFIRYSSPEDGRQAVEMGEVRGVLVIPPEYARGGQPALMLGRQDLNQVMEHDLERFLRSGLLETAAVSVPRSALEPPEIRIHSLDDSREFSEETIVNLLVPFLAAFALIFVVMMTSGSLLKVVAEEKENRMIEVLVTSISPEALIAGKAAGMLGVCLTQIAIWFGAAGLALGVGAQFFEPLRGVSVPWGLLLILGLFFLPTYALIVALMTAIGGAAGEMRQGQQVAGMLNMLFILPMFVSALLIKSPNGLLAVAMTLFPTTAFAGVALRWGFTTIPVWQLILSWLLLASSAGLSVWAAGRVFRLGMLRYGQGLGLREALRGLSRRQAKPARR